VFFAFEDGRTVFTFQIPMSLLFIAGCLVTVWLLSPTWWVVGIALSQTLSYVAGVVLRLNTLRYRIGGVDGRRIISLHVRAGVAAVLSAEMGTVFRAVVPGSSQSVPGAVLALILVGTAMAVVYGVCLRAMGVAELSDFLKPVIVRFGLAGRPAAAPSRHVRRH
jgi:putative peptidoglycan lipid II flippase